MPDETSPTPESTTTNTTAPEQHKPTAPTALQSAISQKKATSLKRSANKPDDKASPTKKSISYADAGVDITSGDRSKQRIKMLARKTFNKQVLSEIGGFGGLFALDLEKFPNPVLVSSADGVGTKLKVAFDLGIHHTVGQDLVNHCVNDIAVQGATPALLPRLPGQRKARRYGHRKGRAGYQRGLPRQRLRAHRRRDRPDARLLRRRRI